MSRAVVEKEHRGITDPDQAYILGELIRYLEHPRSGALELEDMGSSWWCRCAMPSLMGLFGKTILRQPMLLECNVMNQRGNGASDLLGRVRENPDLLILDPAKTIRSFTVAINSPMGLKSGRGQGPLSMVSEEQLTPVYQNLIVRKHSARPGSVPRRRGAHDSCRPDAADPLARLWGQGGNRRRAATGN